MNQKGNKSNYSKLALIGCAVLVLVLGGLWLKSNASDTPLTSLEIQNTAPTPPDEDPLGVEAYVREATASTAANPTNEDDDVTIEAKLSDANNDDYKILVCSSDSLTGTSCTATQLCVSDYVDSGTATSCAIETSGFNNAVTVETDENIPWFAFSCDATSCSSGSTQGFGDALPDGQKSPLVVNHAPTFSFTNSADTDAQDPDTTITFDAEATDNDTYDSAQDTMTLYVCKSASTENCVGGDGSNLWCASGAIAGAPATHSHVTCTDETTKLSVRPDGDYIADYYPYVFDSHNLASTSSSVQGQADTVKVANVAPVVSGISLVTRGAGVGNLAHDVTKPGDTSTGYKAIFTVTDANSCSLKGTTGDAEDFAAAPEIIAATTKANIRMTSVAKADCDAGGEADSDDCIPQIACTQDADSCTGLDDPNATFTCSFSLAYNASPTDEEAAVEGPYDAQEWRASILATDDDSADSGLVDGTGSDGTKNELNQFLAFAAKASNGTSELTEIAYGQMAAAAITADEAATNSKLLAMGNTGLDQKLSGTDMTCVSGACYTEPYPKVLVSAQRYGTANTFDYAASTDILSGSATAFGYCAKPIHSALTPNVSSFWKIKVPGSLAAGVYQGTDTIIGTVTVLANW